MKMPASVLVALALGCGAAAPEPESAASKNNERKPVDVDVVPSWIDPEALQPEPRPWPRFSRTPAPPVVIRHATLLTAAGERIQDGTLVIKDGVITAIGSGVVDAPQGATEIDASGRYVTPGLIDTHSHIGVYPAPHVAPHSDGNEVTGPVTAGARAEYAYWPQDPAITRALAGGVTAAQILPGSANLIGGRGLIVEMRPGRTVDEVMFPGAPSTLKMACGENPKRTYGDKGGPMTRMLMYEAFRQAFAEAADYKVAQETYDQQRADWEKRKARALELEAAAKARGERRFANPEAAPTPPKRDARLETLAGALRGTVLVQVHCYKASDIRQMVKIASEMGFRIRSFHHALEAYKVRDLLVNQGIAISTWADWWGFKMEAFDGIPENAALFTEMGGRAVIHSDSSIDIQHLNQEAAKAMHAGLRAGIKISEDEALRWITANAAWVLGIHELTGSLEVGKRGDVVVWNQHPFSVYARPDQVLIAGEVVYDRQRGLEPTDFELGNSSLAMPEAPSEPVPEPAAPPPPAEGKGGSN